MRALIRTTSFFEQWAAEVLRQPALMFTLVIAPFLLLFAFGEGVNIGGPRPRTLIVQDANAQQPIGPLLEGVQQEVKIVGTTESLPLAKRALQRGDVDAVAVVPPNPNEIIQNGGQIPIHVLIGEIDPVRRSYARSYLRDQVAVLNQKAVAQALAEAQGGAGELNTATGTARQQLDTLSAASNRQQSLDALGSLKQTLQPYQEGLAGLAAGTALVIPGLTPSGDQAASLTDALNDLLGKVDAAESKLQGSNDASLTPAEIDSMRSSLDAIDQSSSALRNIDPNVLSAPFALELEDATPVVPTFTSFYSPGVAALLVHHLAITLAALTLSRMRLLRVTDILRVAPVRTSEIVLGNYISYAILSGLAAAGLIAMLVLALSVPVVGSYAWVAGIVLLLIFSALGLGFLISQLSSSVQQAAQIAMLILLATVFFGGFAFSLDRISWPVRAISYALPATYGIHSLQDVMLRGFEPDLLDVGVLAGSGIVLLVLNVLLLGRSMRASAG
jgi:ABC-2 type transport system permease protein